MIMIGNVLLGILPTIKTIVVAIILFGVIVLAHELGHFLVAKWLNVPAEEFAIGMGPKIYQKKGKNTLFSIRALPLGGFVKFLGEDEDSDDPNALGNAKVWKRIAIIASGPLMNFILAILLLSISFSFFGTYETSNHIMEVVEDSPASEAGLLEGDKILMANGRDIDSLEIEEGIEVFKEIVNENGEEGIDLIIERNDAEVNTHLLARYSEERETYEIGIVFGQMKKHNIFKSLGLSIIQTGRLIILMVQMLGGLIFKGIGLNEVVGPVGIVSEIGKAVRSGAQDVLSFGIIISLNLGIINLIPFPALDGGRLALLFVEGVRGKPMDPNKEGFIHFIGFILLMVLMVVVTFKDVVKQWF